MLNIIILAAGQGKRMHSRLPKVLQPLAGKPLLSHVIKTAKSLNPTGIYVVYGHQGNEVKATFEDSTLIWVEQKEQQGTAHAVQQVLPLLNDDSRVLVLYGDVPLVQTPTLEHLVEAQAQNGLALLVAKVNDPTGLGRIIRDESGQFKEIVEEKDASPAQKAINEIYSGLMVALTGDLKRWLNAIKNDNAQKEFYLTTAPALALAENVKVKTVLTADPDEILGVNTKNQLAFLERVYQKHQANLLMNQGLTLIDPNRFDLRGTLTIGQDVLIDINVIIEGEVQLGNGVRVGANTVLRDVKIDDQVLIKENCVIEEAHLKSASTVGPFSRIRPGTVVASHAFVGNFVEIKKSYIGEGSKVSHLSYIGDTTMGRAVNIGAGTITCNYDGVNKHPTLIGDGAFVGSNTALVAPIEIGPGATVGAGSTVTKLAPAGELTVARAKQISIRGWQRPLKKVVALLKHREE